MQSLRAAASVRQKSLEQTLTKRNMYSRVFSSWTTNLWRGLKLLIMCYHYLCVQAAPWQLS